jgi:aspartyl-tRNA(Asn)/glutamyl-tRNA(Gln) amidotransferase subunit A
MTLFASALVRRLQDFPDRAGELESGMRALVDYFRTLPDGAYFSAWLERGEWWKYPQAVFDEVDLLVTPTTSCPPFPIGLEGPARIENDPASFYDWMSYTYPFNLTGHPAVSVPAGMTAAGLPVGLQIVGPRFADALVLQAAAALQEVRPWPTCWPGSTGATAQ